MAIFTPVSPTNDLAVVAGNTTNAGGDEVVWRGRPLMVVFQNGHASAITVSCAPTQTTAVTGTAGTVNTPTRSLSIPAGAIAVQEWRPEDGQAYLNASQTIPYTYTGHNAALTVRVMEFSA